MKKFYIFILYKILGVSAASGLLYQNPYLYLISDNSHFLYTYNAQTKNLETLKLKDADILEHLPKSSKLDLETLTQTDQAWYTFGSGSTANRNYGFKIHKDTQKVDTLDLSNLYQSMKDFAQIDANDFNIEGVAHKDQEWYFLNRGNGPGQRNVIFTVQGENLTDHFNLFYNDFSLPSIDGAPTGFSDAILIQNKLFFIATAEKVASTYLDGEIAGTMLGVIDIKKMKLEFSQIISREHKFEGIALYHQKSAKEISFLLCEDTDEDTDEDTAESTIYQIDLELQKKIR